MRVRRADADLARAQPFETQHEKIGVGGVAFSPDGTLVAYGGATYTAVWKIKPGKIE